MLHITHIRGTKTGTIQHLGHSPLRIGTSPSSDIAFDPAAERSVAPSHAEIRSDRDAIHIADLGSPQGTFVNGARIQKKRLKTGDRIALGGPSGPEFHIQIEGPLVASEDGKVDLETAQRIVQSAVLHHLQPRGKTKAIIHGKVQEAQARAARNNRLLMLGVLVSLFAASIAAWVVYRKRKAETILAQETGLDRAPAPKISGEIPTQVLSGRVIYEQNKDALYVMGYTLGNRIGGCCSAFAISENTLATNAHCVRACGEKGGTPIVTRNDSGGKIRFNIVKMTMHPAYNPGSKRADTPDVGLLRISGRMSKAVILASEAELRALGPGDDAYVLGFPGRVMDPISPSATFLQGRIGRVMSFEEENTTADKAYLIQHDAVTRGGNSGSPIFNQYGHVIGVHAAHIDEENELDIDGKKTTVVQSSPFRIGMRADLLKGVPAP